MARSRFQEKLRLARRYKEQGAYPEAAEVLREVLAEHPDQPAAMVSLADVYYHQKRYPDAIRLLQKVLNKQPRHPFALYLMGLIAYRQNRTGKAKEYFEKVLELNPGHLSSLKMLALLRIREDKWKEAWELLQRALRQAPDDPFLLVQMARVYQHQGNFPKALELLEKAEKLGSGTDFTRKHILQLRAQLSGKTPEEISRQMAEEGPPEEEQSRANLWELKAEKLQKAGKLPEAIDAYREALQYTPENDFLKRKLAFLYKRMGELEKAEELLVPLFLKDPADPIIRNSLYTLYRERDHLDGWLEILKAALELHPEQKQLFGLLRKFRQEVDALRSLTLTTEVFEAQIQQVEYHKLPFLKPGKEVQPFHQFFVHLLLSQQEVFPFELFYEKIRYDVKLKRKIRKKWNSEYFRSLYQFWMFWVHFYLQSREVEEIPEAMYRIKPRNNYAPVCWTVQEREVLFELLEAGGRKKKEIVKQRQGWAIRLVLPYSWSQQVGSWKLASREDLLQLYRKLPL